MLIWWPLGIDKPLHGTNFDLPVSQVDFFATFADILKYPLADSSKCVYAFDSKTSGMTLADKISIGRPYIEDLAKNKGKYNQMLKGDREFDEFSAKVLLVNSR